MARLPNSRSSLPPAPRLRPPSRPPPSANSAPTKLGRKRKIDDSRCRQHRPPPPPACRGPRQLSRLSALARCSPARLGPGPVVPGAPVQPLGDRECTSYRGRVTEAPAVRAIHPLLSTALACLAQLCLSFPRESPKKGGTPSQVSTRHPHHPHCPTKFSHACLECFTLFCALSRLFWRRKKKIRRGSSGKGEE